MQTYEVAYQLGTSSVTADLRQRVQAVSPVQATAIVEAMFPGAWVKRAVLIG
jgi:hypothetical protein